MAAGIAVLLLIFLVVVVNACQDSARKNAMRGWNQDATAIVQQSDADVNQFFETLRQQNQQPEDLQSAISQLRASGDTNLEQAQDLDVPDELQDAQTSMLIALELRRNALQYISERVQTALGSGGDAADQAIEGIGGEMQAFLASDTIFRMRVTPLTRTALERDDVVADPVETEGVLPGVEWLDPAFVAEEMGTSLTGTEARERNEEVAPGLHGNGLVSTTVNDVALEPDPAANTVALGDGAAFQVTLANQGENDETDVKVKVTLQGGTGDDIVGRGTVAIIAQGEEATADVTLPSQPTAGEVYTVNVEVVAVPGEEKVDNNASSYNVLFE